jgi:hypothetical protein
MLIMLHLFARDCDGKTHPWMDLSGHWSRDKLLESASTPRAKRFRISLQRTTLWTRNSNVAQTRTHTRCKRDEGRRGRIASIFKQENTLHPRGCASGSN